MDNYGIHKGEEIEKAIKKAGARLIFLPPYSPDFSPIENFWSKVKSILRTALLSLWCKIDQPIQLE